MLRLVTSNQRGGDAKTTTTVTLARYLADKGKKVLIIDTDPQGSVAVILGLRSAAQDRSLHNFLIKDYNFSDCIVKVHDNIDLLPSNRQTVETEGTLMGHTARELTFKNVFPRVEDAYQAVLIDVAPSISLLQTCAMLYAEKILIPASMDPLSLQGVVANIETAKILQKLFNIPIRPVAIMPVKVDRRYGLTTTILEALSGISKTVGIPLLPGIRTDGSAMKAASAKQFLVDYDKNCKCLMDYTAAFDELSLLLKDELDESAS